MTSSLYRENRAKGPWFPNSDIRFKICVCETKKSKLKKIVEKAKSIHQSQPEHFILLHCLSKKITASFSLKKMEQDEGEF